MKTQINYKGKDLIVYHDGASLQYVEDVEGNIFSIDVNQWHKVMEVVDEADRNVRQNRTRSA